MKRLIALSAFALVATTTSASLAATSVDVRIGIGTPPPPPVVVVREEPHVVFVPGSSVYVVEDRHWGDYDTFRYGVYWYSYNGGFWYRSRGWRGPYVVLAANRVPRAIINVPQSHWKHHPHGMPPGQARKYDRGRDVYVENDRRVYVKEKGHGNDQGNGKSKGKGHKGDRD